MVDLTRGLSSSQVKREMKTMHEATGENPSESVLKCTGGRSVRALRPRPQRRVGVETRQRREVFKLLVDRTGDKILFLF